MEYRLKYGEGKSGRTKAVILLREKNETAAIRTAETFLKKMAELQCRPIHGRLYKGGRQLLRKWHFK